MTTLEIEIEASRPVAATCNETELSVELADGRRVVTPLWCLLAARRWLGSRSATMRWFSDSAYWVYLVHLPVLLAVQYRLLDMPLHWIVKFMSSIVITLLVSFASYQLLVRHTVIGRLLNGKGRPSVSRVAISGTDTV